jgi:hypothetical protein
VTLRLPTGVDEEAAVQANQRWAEDDGVVVQAQRVRFAPSVSEVLAEFLPPYADGFDIDQLTEVTGTLHRPARTTSGPARGRLNSYPEERNAPREDPLRQPADRLLRPPAGRHRAHRS